MITLSSTPLYLGEAPEERSLIILFIFICFNIDINLVFWEGCTHILLNVINQFRGLCVVFSLDVNLCRDEDVRRPEMDSLDIDETVYFISVEASLIRVRSFSVTLSPIRRL